MNHRVVLTKSFYLSLRVFDLFYLPSHTVQHGHELNDDATTSASIQLHLNPKTIFMIVPSHKSRFFAHQIINYLQINNVTKIRTSTDVLKVNGRMKTWPVCHFCFNFFICLRFTRKSNLML
jgi:hypothetical protein